MGGVDGRALRAGDRLPVGNALDRRRRVGRGIPLALPDGGATRAHRGGGSPRSIHGRGVDGAAARSASSSRRSPIAWAFGSTGRALEHSRGADILSEAMPIGAIQVPASGQPILLMADRQTTGGYPKIANVITADLPLAGQLAPGDWIEFAACTLDDAIAALRAREAELSIAGAA